MIPVAAIPGRGTGTWPARVLGVLGVLGMALLGVAAAPPPPIRTDSVGPTAAHWTFQPVVAPPLPPARAGTPSGAEEGSTVDRFIDARLEAEGMASVGPADRATLIRRASFDLIGLPPTPEEVRAFVAEDAPGAFRRLVDRLLASPRYGERWGRHWLDVVRYADTAGDNADYPVPELHRYRDYVIDAFNQDKPYDRFLHEQLAGDVLARTEARDRYAENIVATGFLALSRRYGTGPYELWHLTLENTLDTIGAAFLGLNLKCARCHDHKFDPLTMRDYYGLYGIFAGTEFPWAGSEEVQSKQFNRRNFVPLVPDAESEPKWAAWEARMASLRSRVAALEKEAPTEKAALDERNRALAALKSELRTLEKPGAPPDLPVAYAVREGRPADVPLQKRGDPATPGEVIPRCLPAALAGPHMLQPATNSSGRLEFARWLTAPDNPLVARVLVNRLWLHHFGQGLVVTPNNLGTRSEPPVHRELLDHLAAAFVAEGWSIKAMHRRIMNSAAYQRASIDHPENARRDPGNRYLWRQARRRLDAEALRDALLHVSGELELARPGAHPFPGPEKWTWTQHTPFRERYDSRHRSVYLMTQRFQKHPFLALFDGPDTNNSTESRRVSTVPQQALFAMNNPFFDARAVALARRVCRDESETPRRVRHLVELAWGRAPRPDETERFLAWRVLARDAVREGAASAQACPEEEVESTAWTALSRVVLAANEFFHVD